MKQNLSPKTVVIVIVAAIVIIGVAYSFMMNGDTSNRTKIINQKIEQTVIGGKPAYPGAKPPKAATMPGGATSNTEPVNNPSVPTSEE
ncbi:MAG: hypothetical protein ACYC0V_19570 [Armatimonadota bacterium]